MTRAIAAIAPRGAACRAAVVGWTLALAGCEPAPNPCLTEIPVAPVHDGTSWRRTPPAPGTPSSFDYPMPRVAQLEGGLTLLHVARPGGTLQLRWVSRWGAGADPPHQSGLAALTARMLVEGTRARDAGELARSVEALGSYLTHDVDRDSTSLSLELLAEDCERGVELLADAALHPRFAADALRRVRNERVDELKQQREEPAFVAAALALRQLLGAELGAPVEGRPSAVNALQSHDLRSFHDRAFAPQHSALIAVGPADFDRLQVAAVRALEHFSPAPVQEPADPQATPNPPDAERVAREGPIVHVVDRPGLAQSAIFTAQRFPRRLAPGHEARQILNGVVGGLFTSRLNTELRERLAFTYGVQSRALATRDWGAFIVSTQVETRHTAAALHAALDVLERAARSPGGAPSEIEIARSKADQIHALGAHLEHAEYLADDLATAFAQRLPPSYYAELPQRLSRLAPAEAVAERSRLQVPPPAIYIVGERSRIRAPLQARGFHVVEADTHAIE